MRNAEYPYLADWFAISLRWVVIFGLTISLGIGKTLITAQNTPNLLYIGVLCLPALWNGFMSILAINNRRLAFHRHINVFLDTLFSISLFAITGGLKNEISWFTLLPVFSGAVYFEARGALPVAIFMTLLQASFAYLTSPDQFQPITVGIVVGFNLIAGTLVALFSAPLVGSLRRSYQHTVTRRKETEVQVQRQERDRMKDLFELIETLSSTLNYQTVLETVLAASVDALGGETTQADKMVGAVMLFGSRNELEVHASQGFFSRDLSIRLPAEEGKLNEILKTGETQVILKPVDDPELGKLVTLHERAVAVCIPLIRSMNAYGVILFAHVSEDFFTPERVDNLQMLGNQAVISIQNARLYQDLAHEKERILQTQEEAQKKLARDLHDGPTQSVAAIAMRLSIARKLLERSKEEANDEMVKIEDLARRTTQEIRHMLFTLRPLVLESEGLISALNMMAEKLGDLYQQKVSVEVSEDVVAQLDATQQAAIFFLVEEAVNNARKHAQAPEIWAKLQALPKDRCIAALDIIDNGMGFDIQSVMSSYDRRGSLGMINLRERSELINGVLSLDSVPGKGTRVRILIPLNAEGADRLNQRRVPNSSASPAP